MLRETAPNLVKKCCLETSMEVRGRQKELHAKLKRSQRKEKQNILTLICVPMYSHSISSVQFSSVQSLSCISLQPHELQHTRPPSPSPTPGVHPNSRPLSRGCHSAISSSVVSSCPQSLPASESFPMSQLFA